MPKAGVNDPAGDAIGNGLRSLGFATIERVRAGRTFHLLVAAASGDDAKEQAVAACERLLANPVIETFQVAVVRPVSQDAGGGR
jgi:phosphoribosylformylglycinamidine synthase